MRIGILGLGTIATAVVEGIADDGHVITVSNRSAANAERLSQTFDTVQVAENAQVITEADVLFLGLLPEVALTVLPTLTFREGQTVISLMADVSSDTLAALVAPARLAARMIPFPAIATGNSPILCFGDGALIDTLFATRNHVFHLTDEAELDAYLCAQAILSPALVMVRTASQWLGTRTHDPDTAERFLRTLVGTSLLSASCETQLAALSTPGGYNQRLRDHMTARAMPHNILSGLDALAETPDS